MSRIGKLKIPVPENVTVTQKDAEVVIKGPGGTLSQQLHPLLSISVDTEGIQVNKKAEHRKADDET